MSGGEWEWEWEWAQFADHIAHNPHRSIVPKAGFEPARGLRPNGF